MVLSWHDKLYCLSLLANCSFFFTQLKCILPFVVSLVYFWLLWREWVTPSSSAPTAITLLDHMYCNYLFMNLLPHQTLWSSSMAGATSYFQASIAVLSLNKCFDEWRNNNSQHIVLSSRLCSNALQILTLILTTVIWSIIIISNLQIRINDSKVFM